jgi:hypothetical protein
MLRRLGRSPLQVAPIGLGGSQSEGQAGIA